MIMATTNGDSVTQQSRSASPIAANLGKRKRSHSHDLLAEEGVFSSSNGLHVQQSMESVLKLLRVYDPSPSLLNYPLPVISSDEPSTKRPRLARTHQEFDNIENRVMSGVYKSLEEMVVDVNRAASAILDSSQALAEQVNGEARSRTGADAKAKEQITTIRDLVTKQLNRQKGVQKAVEDDEPREVTDADISNIDQQDRGQVLTLRTQTEKGPRQIYSGLQVSNSTTTFSSKAIGISLQSFEPIDGKTLPNGFELTDPVLLDAHMKRKHERDSRTFGDVFKPHRSLKPLELPRASRNFAKTSKHSFITTDNRIFDTTMPTFKGDYKFSTLPTGQWLEYSEKSLAQSNSGNQKGQRDRTVSVGGSGVEENANENLDVETAETKALFQQTYSSFAPTYDNSAAVISERTRGQIWWKRAGQRRFQTLFSLQYPEDVLSYEAGPLGSNDEFADMIENFEPENKEMKAEDDLVDKNDTPEADALLREVSDLLETLNSYQRIRHTESPKPSNVPRSPSLAEFDMYEIIRSQLAVLVDSLPPFAVAKLNSDQLEELGISTKFVTATADYPGTAEVDDFTLEKRKAAHAASSAAARTVTSAAPVRPNTYQTPSAAAAAVVAANYNPRARSYNTNISTSNTPTYATSNTAGQSFQTPRLPATVPRPNFPPQSYQPSTNPQYSQHANVQQFQRPIPNGYGNYPTNTPSQSTYLQRPVQTNYQQGVGIGPRSGSPQKAIVNGQGPQLQYSPQSQPQFQTPRPQQGAGNFSPAIQAVHNLTTDQRAMMERLKAQNQGQYQTQQGQRQGSGTPHPQTPVAGGDNAPRYGRYDGVDEQSASVTPSLDARPMPLTVAEASR